MVQRAFIDLPSESISETVFRIHEDFASDLRQSLRAMCISPMARCNQNHELLFDEIKHKIRGRYYEKHRSKETAGRSTPARPVLKLRKTRISRIIQLRRAIRLWFVCVF